MNLRDFKRLTDPIRKKIFLLLGRAILYAIDNSESTQTVQVMALSDEVITGIERFQEYGLETYPLAEAEVFIGFLNGNRGHGIALCVHDRRYRPTDLIEGEVALYTSEDKTSSFRIHLKTGRIFDVKGDQLIETFDTIKTTTVPTELHTNLSSHAIDSKQVMLGSAEWASVRELVDSRFTDLFNDHVHSGVDVGPGNTGAPTTTLGAAHLTSKTRAS